MDGIEKIIHRLEEAAAEEIKLLLSVSQTQAASVTAAFKEQADAEYKTLVAKGRLAAEEQGRRLRSVADLESRKLILAEKQANIEAAFTAAAAKLQALDDAARVPLYARLICASAADGREAVILSAAERERIGAAVVAAANAARPGAAFSLSPRTAPLSGGLILSSTEMDVNCSFEALLRQLREEMAGEVGAMLYD